MRLLHPGMWALIQRNICSIHQGGTLKFEPTRCDSPLTFNLLLIPATVVAQQPEPAEILMACRRHIGNRERPNDPCWAT